MSRKIIPEHITVNSKLERINFTGGKINILENFIITRFSRGKIRKFGKMSAT